VSPAKRRGRPRQGGLPDNRHTDDQAAYPTPRVSLALRMRAQGYDHRAIRAVAGEDADRLAAVVEDSSAAMHLLRSLGTPGLEDARYEVVRRLSRTWRT
jgi:hypothetical protein